MKCAMPPIKIVVKPMRADFKTEIRSMLGSPIASQIAR